MITRMVKTNPAIAYSLIWFVCAIGGIFSAKAFSVLDFVDNWVADLRLTTTAPSMEQRQDIVILTITEDTLAQHPYRFPLDRGMLAEAVEKLSGAGARAIGMDILFDQPTEPEKDNRLAGAIANSRVPVVVGWASEAEGLTPAQVTYLKD